MLQKLITHFQSSFSILAYFPKSSFIVSVDYRALLTLILHLLKSVDIQLSLPSIPIQCAHHLPLKNSVCALPACRTYPVCAQLYQPRLVNWALSLNLDLYLMIIY